MAIAARGYTAGRFALEVGNIKAGWVQSVEGGHASSDVIQNKLGPDHLIKKHIGGVKFEDITINCGTGMSKGFYEWVKASFDHKHTRQDGAIHTADYDNKIVSTLNFHQALISEIGFPALDAAGKDGAKMTIKLSPEWTAFKKGGGTIGGMEIGKGQQKKWLPANFRLTIAGLEEACKHVNKIEALVVKQKIVENPVGELRTYEKEPAHLEIPNLVVTFTESHADAFYQWHEDFVIKGNNGEDKEKTATLEYLTPDLGKTLFKLDFQNVGIFKLTPDKVEAGAEKIRSLKAEMYVENILFNYTGDAVWA
jgi:phage tail-like protein